MKIFKISNYLDIRDFSHKFISNFESPLENSVRLSNQILLKKITVNDKILEVGCGFNSYFKNNFKFQVNWHGIDVQLIDARGRKTIASKIGSVDNIPYKNNYFDYVLSNQSIEHWHEYGVDPKDGILEIYRTLKFNGKLFINFPFFLHGHPIFVRGDLKSVLSFFPKNQWRINSVNLYYDSENLYYKGWRRCGFPDFYIKRYSECKSSFVIEIEAQKISEIHLNKNIKKHINFISPKRRSALYLTLIHGIDVFIWKIFRKIIK